jgi:hypothetical protein
MLRIVAGMGLALVLAACGGGQAAAPGPKVAAPPTEPAVGSTAAPSPAPTSVELPVASASSPPSDTPAAATTTEPGDGPPVDTSSDATPASPPPLGSGTAKTAAELAAEAQTAAKAGQWGRALNLAEQALRARPDNSTKLVAMTTAALSACNLKNLAKAKQYLLQLPASRQALIRQRCLANGVTVTP